LKFLTPEIRIVTTTAMLSIISVYIVVLWGDFNPPTKVLHLSAKNRVSCSSHLPCNQ